MPIPLIEEKAGTFLEVSQQGASDVYQAARVHPHRVDGRGHTDHDHHGHIGSFHWCCYAWPARHGTTGRRTFFTDAGADILFTENPDYAGLNCIGIRGGNAYQTGKVDSVTGTIAAGTIGADGKLWRYAN